MVSYAIKKDERSLLVPGPIHAETRIDFVHAWGEGRFIDPTVNQEACARLCIARKDEVQSLITFDFWLSDLARCHEQWTGFLASLQLGQWVSDPQQGPTLS